MKKLFVAASLLVASLSVSAQEYKPVSGATTLELQFAPLSGSPFSMGGIRFRKFIADKTAFRGTVFIGYSSSSDITQQADDDADILELKDKNSAFNIAIRPGIEKHLEGTDRLSPYLGAELDFAIGTSKLSEERQVVDEIETDETKNADGFTRFGLNGIFGADYYVAEKVFLGAELGFGFSYKKDATETFTSGADGVDPVETKKGGEFTLAPNVLGTFRLGIVF